MKAVERVRRAVPLRAVPALARLRASWAMRDEATRARARAHMELLLGQSRPDADLDAATVDFVRFYLARPELHRHPRQLWVQRVHGTEHLAEASARGRGVVLHFLHHGLYEASITSLGRQTLIDDVIVEADLVGDGPHTSSRLAYVELLRIVDFCRSNEIGIPAIEQLLRDGRTVALATDRPGRTAVDFCGRRLYSQSGAVRIAVNTDSPVVVLTAERTPSGEVVGRLHPAVEPGGFDSPDALLQHLVGIHEPSVLAWPAAYVFPLDCWGTEAPAPRAPR